MNTNNPHITNLDYGDRGHVIVTTDSSAMAQRAADLILSHSIQARDQNRIASIALSGGSTPKAMGELLATEPLRSEVAWNHLRIFWGDERWVPLSDPESNAGEARRGYLDAVTIPTENVIPFETEHLTPKESASKLESMIRMHLSGDPTPRFDLILLGMGGDGHTASLFPDTEAIQEHHDLVVSHLIEKLSSIRLTFTPALINAAKNVVFLVGGTGKADMLEQVLDGGIDVDRLPSQVVRPTNGTLTWIVDRAAAAELERFGVDV
ncbi:MAG: 6-phosphogluconolactonase [Thermomicrobiales bacterium]